MPKNKKPEGIAEDTVDLKQQLGELTIDLQRTRADFENYRKRTEAEKDAARVTGKANAILRLLPVIDNIERAISHTPNHLVEDKWAQGVAGLTKNLEKSLESLGLARINATPGTPFNPEYHEAISMEEGDGEAESIVEELQAGYLLDGQVIRHSMVKVRG